MNYKEYGDNDIGMGIGDFDSYEKGGAFDPYAENLNVLTMDGDGNIKDSSSSSSSSFDPNNAITPIIIIDIIAFLPFLSNATIIDIMLLLQVLRNEYSYETEELNNVTKETLDTLIDDMVKEDIPLSELSTLSFEALFDIMKVILNNTQMEDDKHDAIINMCAAQEDCIKVISHLLSL